MSDCPNPRCVDGNVPGGPKGDLLCSDCLRAGRVRAAGAPRVFPAPITSPVDPPRVAGTEITRDVGGGRRA